MVLLSKSKVEMKKYNIYQKRKIMQFSEIVLVMNKCLTACHVLQNSDNFLQLS